PSRGLAEARGARLAPRRGYSPRHRVPWTFVFIAVLRSPPAAGVGIFAALAAGIVSFLSPCVLPLVPGYLSAVTGVSAGELETAGRRPILPPRPLFVPRLSTIFLPRGVAAPATRPSLQKTRKRSRQNPPAVSSP